MGGSTENPAVTRELKLEAFKLLQASTGTEHHIPATKLSVLAEWIAKNLHATNITKDVVEALLKDLLDEGAVTRVGSDYAFTSEQLGSSSYTQAIEAERQAHVGSLSPWARDAIADKRPPK